MIIGAAAAVTAPWRARPARAQTTALDVLYSVPSGFTAVQEAIARRFSEAHPELRIAFRAPAADYEQGVQQILRGAFTGGVPDVAFIGANQIRLLVDRDLATPLGPLAQEDGGWERLGYIPAMTQLGRIGNDTYALPFAISTPILYVNVDLVRRAGGSMEDFPTTWPELVALGARIKAAGDASTIGLHFQWDASSNWMFQALLFSRGGKMASDDECAVGFDSDAGRWALDVLESFPRSGMPHMSWQQTAQAFVAGSLGIHAASTANVANAGRQIGDRFAFRTAKFPVPGPHGLLPAGGSTVAILARDPAKRRAAWEYVKFATGPVGQTMMVNQTGYMPGNAIALRELDAFYARNPNYQASLQQLPLMTGWYAWPGENALRITDVIKGHVEAVISGGRTAADTMPRLVHDVAALLPPCGQRG
jgi:multiple sugar transport system substrate-binding protein